MQRDTMWKFTSGRFHVRATIQPDPDCDCSFDETGETADKVASGEWDCFGTVIEVRLNGVVIGEDSLWGSIYADPRDFFTAHRDPDPANRNSTLNGLPSRHAIGHYFPDMVRQAIAEAREWMRNAKLAA